MYLTKSEEVINYCKGKRLLLLLLLYEIQPESLNISENSNRPNRISLYS